MQGVYQCLQSHCSLTPLIRGGVTESKENPDLAMFTTKVLLDEIKARGYSGTLEYKKTIRI